MTPCYKSGSDPCYEKAGDDFAKKFTLPTILAIFEQNEDKPEIFSRCHQVTHYLGREEFFRTHSVPVSFHNASSACHGGSYHGIIEGYFKYKGISLLDTPALESNIRSVCGKSSDYEKATIYSECVHGIGHAMMFITSNELPESLAFCDSLLSRSDQTTCYGGVFMENSSSSTNLDHPTKYLKADDALYPCDSLEERYLETCYSYQSSYFSRIAQFDWTKVDALCQSIPVAYQSGCFRFIGSNQVGFTQDMNKRKANCNLLSTAAHRTLCYDGLVGALAGRFNTDFPLIASFCAMLAEGDKAHCYEQVGYSLLGWEKSPQDLVAKCATIPEQVYADACSKAGVSR
jgi:hypothetical protein